MTPADILRKAADKISKPGAWQRHALARNKHGDVVSASHPNATCWCAVGALHSFNIVHRFRGKQALSCGRALTFLAAAVKTPHLHTSDMAPEQIVTTFNDVAAKDASEVASKMREAADAWEASNAPH